MVSLAFLGRTGLLSCRQVIYTVFPNRPKDAMRAVRKRLNGNRNFREVMLALTVSSLTFT